MKIPILGFLSMLASQAWRAGFSLKSRASSYAWCDAKARRKRIAKWRAKKKAGNLERNRQRMRARQ